MTNNSLPPAGNGNKPHLNKVRRLQNLVAYLESELDQAATLLDSAVAESMAPNDSPSKVAALLAVGNAATAGGDAFGWTDQAAVRAFGLTVAYSLCDAVLTGMDFLPDCFTLDDVVLAAAVLSQELTEVTQ